MYKCCIFDLDGTLIDSIKAISYTANLTLEKYGYPAISDDLYKIFVGEGAKKLIEKALLHSGDSELTHLEDGFTTYLKYFEIHCMHEVKPYDGIIDMLKELKDRGVKLAVLSNKPHERTLDNIKGVFGEDYFSLVSGEKEGIRRKPDPAGAILTADILGFSPSECLYLGDTSTDMETGISAGMDTVGVTWGFRERSELESYSPKYVIDSPMEILSIVK